MAKVIEVNGARLLDSLEFELHVDFDNGVRVYVEITEDPLDVYVVGRSSGAVDCSGAMYRDAISAAREYYHLHLNYTEEE